MILFKLKQAIKRNAFLDSISRILLSAKFDHQYKLTDQAAEQRLNGYEDSRYKWIKDLKDTHLGERCFVVATGPSLKMSDLELIKDEFCFGMNSTLLCFDKTNWRPSFYMIQDENVYEKLQNEISYANEKLSFPIVVNDVIAQKYQNARLYKRFPYHFLDHKKYHKNGFGEFKFSDDCYKIVYDGYSVIFSILQFACYMGFKEIYLLGCDCNYNQKKTHFVDYGFRDPKAAIAGDRILIAHSEFKKFADSIGVMVINCTRGGMLEVYQRMKLEEVMEERK